MFEGEDAGIIDAKSINRRSKGFHKGAQQRTVDFEEEDLHESHRSVKKPIGKKKKKAKKKSTTPMMSANDVS
jgi:hypothetical protein